MHKLIWLWLFLGVQVSASTVIYTTYALPPPTAEGADVVYLDLPDKLLAQFFPLPDNPQQAEEVALKVVQSTDWVNQQQQLMASYQGLIKAWQLNLQKYPAVVFEERWVVYGTADVEQARWYLTQMKPEGQ